MASEGKPGTISPQEARELLATSGARAVDVRDEDDFAEGHIPVAVNVPPDDVESHLDDLPEDERIVVIGDGGSAAEDVAAKLADKGYDAVVLKGGLGAWKRAGNPIQPAEDFEFEGPGDTQPGI